MGRRNEVFQELGKINVQGLELAFDAELINHYQHQLHISGNGTYMQSKVLEGTLLDKDLFSLVIHSSTTKREYISKVKEHRNGFEIYVSDGADGETLLTDEVLDVADFDHITKSVITFGKEGIENTEVPYTPKLSLTAKGIRIIFCLAGSSSPLIAKGMDNSIT